MTLTPRQWDEIRQRYADGESTWDLAREFGISAGSIASRVSARAPLRKRHLTASQRQELRRRRAAGETLASLGEAFGIGTSQVSKIARAES